MLFQHLLLGQSPDARRALIYEWYCSNAFMARFDLHMTPTNRSKLQQAFELLGPKLTACLVTPMAGVIEPRLGSTSARLRTASPSRLWCNGSACSTTALYQNASSEGLRLALVLRSPTQPSTNWSSTLSKMKLTSRTRLQPRECSRASVMRPSISPLTPTAASTSECTSTNGWPTLTLQLPRRIDYRRREREPAV
jgi:hypothetical protein